MDLQALRALLQGASNSAAGTVSAPVDALSWLLNKAGVNTGEAVGGSDWMRRKGLTADAPGWAGIAGESLGNVVPIMAAAKAPQIAAGLNRAAANAAIPSTMNPELGAIVYHGSPHKFDAFDASKIGSENGNLMGYGTNFSEAEKFVGPYGIGGSTYKVDIPDAKINKMISLDDPLSTQASVLDNAQLMKILKRLSFNIDRNGVGLLTNFGSNKALSTVLQQHDIPGFKYLADLENKLVNNYVVFPGEESALRILERNGTPLEQLIGR